MNLGQTEILMKENKSYAVPAILRAIAVLNHVGEKGQAGFNEICEELELSKSTAYGVLNTLLQEGFLRHSAHGGYSLGIALFSLGSKALSTLDIRSEAQPIMQALVDEVDQTSHLGVLDGGEAVYLAKVECAQNLIVRSWVGMRLSLQTSAMGKVILAWREDEEIRALLRKNPPTRYTGRAILDIEAFIGHLGLVREHGVAVDNRETNEDNLCLAAPVFSAQPAPVGAVSVSIPNPRLNREVFDLVARRVHAACSELSHRLGSAYYPAFKRPEYPGE